MLLSLCRYFDCVDVCKVREDWNETRVQGIFPSNAQEALKIVKLTVFQTTEIELGLFQEGVRYSIARTLRVRGTSLLEF